MNISLCMAGDVNMVDTSKIVPLGGEWLKPELIEGLQRSGKEALFVVLPGSGIEDKDFPEVKDGQTIYKKSVKPWITGEIDGKRLKWSLSATANQIIGSELGFETDLWVGATLKPFVDVVAGRKTLKAVVIKRP